MDETSRFDVIVVGAGPLGAATTRHLAYRGASVLVIGPEEPARFDDHQGTWAGYYDQGRLGHVLEVPLMTTMLASRSIRRFAELEARSGITFTKPTHSLSVLPTAEENTQAATWFDAGRLLRNAADVGVPVEALDERDLRTRYSRLRFPPGHMGIVQKDAFIVNPRELVRAELTAATSAGAKLVRDQVVELTRVDDGVQVTARSGETWHADRIVLATGAATNATGLLDRPLPISTYGATVVLVEVEDPNDVDMPAMMYMKSSGGQIRFGGIVMSPLQYPDGKWYVKVSGRSLHDYPLHTADEIAAWVRTGGRSDDITDTLEVLAELMPDQRWGDAHTRPCLVCETPSDLPYIDRIDDRTTVVIEGERGAMAADEIGRLAADLTLTGQWSDGIPHEPFRIPRADAVGLESQDAS